jgi:hypothetical protein
MANHVNNGNAGYKGPERRKYARRLITDRRKEIRWEPNNPNRRQSSGRRAVDQLGVLAPKR